MRLGSGSIWDEELDVYQIKLCEKVSKLLGIYVGTDKQLFN